LKVALVQLDIAWQKPELNFQRAANCSALAAQEGCDVVVFPEMFNTGFSMDLSVISDEGIGETTSFLSGLARSNKINLIAGFAMKSPAEKKGRNLAVVFDRTGTLTAAYTKIHPFCLAEEDKYFLAGENVTIFDIDGIPSSVFVCYDLRFPEVFRKVARQVKAVFVIANWPSSRKRHWEILLKARAIENQCFVIGVNRTGTDGNGVYYSGGSCAVDPMGNILCNGNEEEYVICDLDFSKVHEVRAQYPFLNDMKLISNQQA